MRNSFPKFGYNPITGEWNDSLRGEYCWSGVNFMEAAPDVMTPMTWSLFWIYLFRTTPTKFPGGHPIGGNIAGRLYFNVSLMASLYNSVGMDAREQMLGDLMGSTPEDLDIPYLPFSPIVVIGTVLPGIIKDKLSILRDIRQFKSYLSSIPAWCQSMQTRIQQCSDAAGLLALWNESIYPRILRDLRMLRSTVIHLSTLATRLNLALNKLVGEAEANTLLSNLSGASGRLESLGPMIGLARVNDGRMSCEEYIQQFGHRGPHEADFSFPSADEDPDWLNKALADFKGSGRDLEARLDKQRAAVDSSWQRFKTRFPGKYESFHRRLEQVIAAAHRRESYRSEWIRSTRVTRKYLLQVGMVTGIGEDVFYITMDEMIDLLAGNRQPLSMVSARREMYQKYSALPRYPAIIYGRFDPFKWAADPHRRSDFYDARKIGAVAPASTIKGLAGAAGCVEGIVRRIDRAEDGNQLQPGEILVTTITNIGWTPLFPRLAAVVTDVGAPLSHAAIVAREMGIPAVVGCGNATMLLKTGDRVRVDGGLGTVEILSRMEGNG